MLIFSLTLLYFFVAIQDTDSHVIRTRDPVPIEPAEATATAVMRPRNLDIPFLIDPVQQAGGAYGDLDDSQGARANRSVFSVPARGSSGSSALDCPQGTRQVGANGPCLQETPTIKTTGDKFLVDSLRKFYSPNTHHLVRPHHRKRRPSSTTAASTTTRRHEFVPSYITGDLDHGHEPLKPDDDTLTISAPAAISSPTNEFATTEITTKVNSVTEPTTTTPIEADEAKTVVPEPMSPTTPLPLLAVTETTEPQDADERVVFETEAATTPLPTEAEIETTLRYVVDEPVEVTTDIVQDGDKSHEAVTTDAPLVVKEIPTEQPVPAEIMGSEVEETTATEAMTNVLSPTTATDGEVETDITTRTTMPMSTEYDEAEIGVTQPTPTSTDLEFVESKTTTPAQEVTTLAPNQDLLLENIEIDPHELSDRPGRVPSSVPTWAPLPNYPHPHGRAQQLRVQPVRQQTPSLPVQVDIRNSAPLPFPPSSVTQAQQLQRPRVHAKVYQNGNLYQNDFYSLDYVNMNNHNHNSGHGQQYSRTNFNSH